MIRHKTNDDDDSRTNRAILISAASSPLRHITHRRCGDYLFSRWKHRANSSDVCAFVLCVYVCVCIGNSPETPLGRGLSVTITYAVCNAARD